MGSGAGGGRGRLLLSRFLSLFYSHLKGADPYAVVATTFFPQKVLQINGRVGWPVSFRSRVLHHRNIEVGERSFPGWSQGCYIQARNGIVIGNNLRMGPGVGLVSANHDENDYDRWGASGPIRIGDNVWIGMNSVVLPGVTIGSNVIIGAGSVVNRDIPNDVIAAGNPCRVLRSKEPYRGKTYG